MLEELTMGEKILLNFIVCATCAILGLFFYAAEEEKTEPAVVECNSKVTCEYPPVFLN